MILLLGMSTAALVIIVVIGTMTLRQAMMDDRIDKLRAMVGSAVAVAAALEVRVGAQEINPRAGSRPVPPENSCHSL